jgi:hypothetical protein
LGLGGGDIAGFDRRDESRSGGDQFAGLAQDVGLVVLGGFLEDAGVLSGERRARDGEVAADAVADHAGLAGHRVGARFVELDDQLTLQAG